MKNTKILIISFILLGSVVLFSQSKTGKIVGIKDGDTVILLKEDSSQVTIRLAEVDCPEKKQAFGSKAKQFTSDQVYLKKVNYLITDTDRYGRCIGKIYYDNNKYLSEEIIKAGYGWHYYKFSNSKKLESLQISAKDNRRGLWRDMTPVAPWDFRKKNKF